MKPHSNKICTCPCHKDGENVIHFMSCCQLCALKYISKDEQIDEERYRQLLAAVNTKDYTYAKAMAECIAEYIDVDRNLFSAKVFDTEPPMIKLDHIMDWNPKYGMSPIFLISVGHRKNGYKREGVDYRAAKKMANVIHRGISVKTPNAVRVIDTEPPVVEVCGITDEILKITVDVVNEGGKDENRR